MIPVMLIWLAGSIFWIWMLVHSVRNNYLSGAEKALWFLCVFFLSWFGALLYLFLAGPASNKARMYSNHMSSYSNTYYTPPTPYYTPPTYHEPQQQPPIYYRPQSSAATPQQQPSYRPYSQGYTAARREEPPRENVNPWPDYEEPQTSYPHQELPPQ